jgi:hypothetical protein
MWGPSIIFRQANWVKDNTFSPINSLIKEINVSNLNPITIINSYSEKFCDRNLIKAKIVTELLESSCLSDNTKQKILLGCQDYSFTSVCSLTCVLKHIINLNLPGTIDLFFLLKKALRGQHYSSSGKKIDRKQFVKEISDWCQTNLEFNYNQSIPIMLNYLINSLYPSKENIENPTPIPIIESSRIPLIPKSTLSINS